MKLSLFISVCFTLICCKNDDVKKKYIITDFDKIICDTMKPKKEFIYSAKTIRVKGYANDSIFISFGNGHYEFYLSQDIDTIMNSDYYGESEAIFIFNPYKAKKGRLEVEFDLIGFNK